MRQRIQAWVISQPWSDSYEVRITVDDHPRVHAAAVENGRFVYREYAQGAVIDPVLRLTHDEIQALAKELSPWKDRDVAAEALDDARSVRDRLLALIERAWPT